MPTPRCEHAGCNRDATCVPRLLIPAAGHPIDTHRPIGLVMGVELCDEHFKTDAKIDLLAPAGMERGIRDIVGILTRDKCPPDWDRAFVERVALDSNEYRAFNASASTGALVDAGNKEDHPCDA